MTTVKIETATIKGLKDCDKEWAESVARTWMAEITWEFHATINAGKEFYQQLCSLRNNLPSIVYVTKGEWWQFTFCNIAGKVLKTPKLEGTGETVKLLMPLLGDKVRASKKKPQFTEDEAMWEGWKDHHRINY